MFNAVKHLTAATLIGSLFSPLVLAGPYHNHSHQPASQFAAVATSPALISDQFVNLDKQDSFSFELPNIGTVTAVLNTRVQREDGSFSWLGQLQGEVTGQIALVINKDNITGQVMLEQSQYSVYSQGPGLVEIKALPILGLHESDGIPALTTPAATRAQFQIPTSLMASKSDIDILVAYTAEAEAESTTSIKDEIQLAVDITNQAFVNSNIDIQLNLVFTYLTDYQENPATCNKMNTPLTQLRLPNDGVMDNVSSYREKYGADLVSLWLRDGCGYGGLGYVIPADSADGGDWAFTTMARYYGLHQLALAHEIGHNLSASHDRGVDPDHQGYNIGYVDYGNRFRTIMAYNQSCFDQGYNCTRVPHFSNPEVDYEYLPGQFATTGVAIGLPEQADNASAFANTRHHVAAFRDSKSCDPQRLQLFSQAPIALTQYQVNETMPLVVSVESCGQNVTGAEVSAHIFNDTVALFDDGLHQDGQANDGIYGGNWQGQTHGEYRIEYRATKGSQVSDARSVAVSVNADYILDISAKATATASNEYSATYGAEKVLDGNTGTFWATRNAISEHIELSWQQTYQIESVTVNWANNYYVNQFHVEALQNGSWLKVSDDIAGDPQTNLVPLNITADALRLVLTKPAGDFYGIGEITVFGKDLSGDNTAPSIELIYPQTGVTIREGNNSLSLVAKASDVEEGDISQKIVWTSDLQGQLGQGGQVNGIALIAGSHVITASVTDLANSTDSATLIINVEGAPNSAPILEILSPRYNATQAAGSQWQLTADAFDNEDGDLSPQVQWSSDIDGPLATGASINVVLTEGSHTLKALIKDSKGAEVFKFTKVTVEATSAVNTAPTLSIITPANLASQAQDSQWQLSVTAADNEDGDLSQQVQWTSNIDGALGQGANINVILSVGEHTLQAKVSDSQGLIAEEVVQVSVVASPTQNTWDKATVYRKGEEVVYQGQAYRAKWYAHGDVPGATQWGPWQSL